jgi:hypothetical protein
MIEKTLKWNAVNPNQFVAWRYLDGKICVSRKLRPAPMPWQLSKYSCN